MEKTRKSHGILYVLQFFQASNEVSMRGSFLPMIVAVVDILLIVLIIVVVLLIVRTKR